MIRVIAASIAAAALVAAVPATAQTQAAELSEAQRNAFASWLEAVSEAMTVASDGVQALGEIRPLFAAVRSPAEAKAVGPRIRAIVAGARRKTEQANAMLAAMSVPDLDLGAGLTPKQIVSEARDQNAKVLELLGNVDGLMVAMEIGDRTTGDRLAPKVLEGAFLLIDSNRLLMRNRQAMIPTSESSHQALGVLLQIYRGMKASASAWLRSRGGPQEAVAASFRTELGALARDVRLVAAAGRKNLARERGEVEAGARAGGLSASESADLAAMGRMLDEEAKVFALADDIAALAERESATTAAALTRQASPELLAKLSELELRFHAITTAQTTIAAGIAR
ncbi:hypothetical protein E2493_18640 [Sphingomonas parva]|uniref:Uncharacterized protein n=1 Tax=Sphingomonas parva TaxID=2555898 RepID=A0A4Y8ZLA8_9SPHN|nr:hypothetical protein [Sphingomonas parva]TFI56778.1 hypothetical protein E2493_18640 [Sphingomonas parva]